MWDATLPLEIAAMFARPCLWDLSGPEVEAEINEYGWQNVIVFDPPVAHRKSGEPCPGCGKLFDPRPNGKAREFCSDTCRAAHHNKLVSEQRAQARAAAQAVGAFLRTCECGCGAMFEARATGGRQQRFATPKCGKRLRDARSRVRRAAA